MAKTIYFDMDGTIADLYGTPNWLTDLQSETKGLFRNLKVMHDKEKLTEIFHQLKEMGFAVEVITWTPKNVSDKYIKTVEIEKKEWIKEHFPIIEKIHCLDYGTPKQNAPIKNTKHQILVDDNIEVNTLWETPVRRKSILADKDLINKLQALCI